MAARIPHQNVVRWLLFLVVIAGCQNSVSPPSPSRAELLTFTGSTMGTSYTVKIVADSASPDNEEIQAHIDAILKSVNDQMSTWQPDSEISLFNSSESTDWFEVSPETASVVEQALQLAELSGGAFDPTVGPLVNLWHFGPDKQNKIFPTDEQVENTKARVGYQHVEARLQPPALRKEMANIALDLSAIAKGHGVDRVAEYLETLHLQGYLVEIGGEMRSSGTKSDGSAWKVGIEAPTPGERHLHTTISLMNASLATSGDYRNYFEHDGKRYSHTIDPRTGRPVTHGLTSVSIIADTCTAADAWATTLMVLGPVDGYNFAEENGVAALLLIHDGGDLAEKRTPAFVKLVSP